MRLDEKEEEKHEENNMLKSFMYVEMKFSHRLQYGRLWSCEKFFDVFNVDETRRVLMFLGFLEKYRENMCQRLDSVIVNCLLPKI